MKRWLFFFYGVANYVLFFAVYLYLCLFIGDLLLSQTIDGPVRVAAKSPMLAAAINLLLIIMFGLQHSVMARPGFKAIWTRIVPQPIERATYMLASCLALIALMVLWQPMPAVVWNISSSAGRATMWSLFAAGWLLVPAVSYMINHFDLFGMRQVWLHLKQTKYESLPFRTPLLYAHVRHPLYLGWALAFCAAPTMTAGHALLAAALTSYMVLATVFEERDLVAHFGEKYREYQERVPRFFPRITRSGFPREANQEQLDPVPATFDSVA